MPKLSASRPAWSMNWSRWRRVSHTASGPMTEPKGTISPAKVDRWATAAVVRTVSSAVAGLAAAVVSSSARVAPQWGQVVVWWSSLAEQAGQVLFMNAPWSASSLGAPVGTVSTIGRRALGVVGRQATVGDGPAGAAQAGRHPPGGVQLVGDRQPGSLWSLLPAHPARAAAVGGQDGPLPCYALRP